MGESGGEEEGRKGQGREYGETQLNVQGEDINSKIKWRWKGNGGKRRNMGRHS